MAAEGRAGVDPGSPIRPRAGVDPGQPPAAPGGTAWRGAVPHEDRPDRVARRRDRVPLGLPPPPGAGVRAVPAAAGHPHPGDHLQPDHVPVAVARVTVRRGVHRSMPDPGPPGGQRHCPRGHDAGGGRSLQRNTVARLAGRPGGHLGLSLGFSAVAAVAAGRRRRPDRDLRERHPGGGHGHRGPSVRRRSSAGVLPHVLRMARVPRCRGAPADRASGGRMAEASRARGR